MGVINYKLPAMYSHLVCKYPTMLLNKFMWFNFNEYADKQMRFGRLCSSQTNSDGILMDQTAFKPHRDRKRRDAVYSIDQLSSELNGDSAVFDDHRYT